MRNFKTLLVSLFCLFSMSVYAGERENLQKEISVLLKSVSLAEIREIQGNFKPLWGACRSELVSIAESPVETLEQIRTAQRRLLLVRLCIIKLEVRKEMAVVANGYTENEYQISPDELANARAKLATLKLALTNANNVSDICRVKLQLIGVRKKGPISVLQHLLKFQLQALKQGNIQLITGWGQNKKSAAGLEKLKAVQRALVELEPGAASNDRRQLEKLHWKLIMLDLQILGIFTQEP